LESLPTQSRPDLQLGLPYRIDPMTGATALITQNLTLDRSDPAFSRTTTFTSSPMAIRHFPVPFFSEMSSSRYQPLHIGADDRTCSLFSSHHSSQQLIHSQWGMTVKIASRHASFCRV
jgi:hypothetical protein